MESTPHADSTQSAAATSAESDLLDFFGCAAPPASSPTTASANVAATSDTMNAAFDPFAALLDLSPCSVSQVTETKPSDQQCQNSLLDSDLFDFDPFQPAPAMASKTEKADDSLQEEEWLLVDKEEVKDADKEKSTTAKDKEEKDEAVKEKEEEKETEKEDEEEGKKEFSSPPAITVDRTDDQKGEVPPMMDVDGEIVQLRRKPAETSARESTSSVGSDSDKRLSRNSSMEVDADIDFSAIQDTEQLDVEVPKHKSSLRRHSSLAKRKRPTRNSIRYSIREGDDESFYVDSTEPRPPVESSGESGSSKEGSPVANDVSSAEAEQPKKPPPGAGRRLLPSGLDLSKIKRRKESSSSPSDEDEPPPPPKEGPPSEPTSQTAAAAEEEKPVSVEEAEAEEKPAAPRKLPPGARPMMPGLQDLNKSKLFGQDRSTKEAAKATEKDEKEAAQPTPAPRPALKPVSTPAEKKQEEPAPKPALKPALKPISKEQKDSQNQSTVEKESAADKPDSVTPSKLLGKKPVVPTKPAANSEPAPAPALPTLRKVTRQNSKDQTDGGREKSPALELPTLKKVGTPAREGSSERDKEDSDREKTPPAWLSEMKLKKAKPASGEEKSNREKTPETPAWMKAAQDRKARAAADAEKAKENQGKPEEAAEEKRPPWLSESSLKKAPKPAPLKESKEQEENKPPVTPRRRPGSTVGKPLEKEPSPPKTEGESYKPSWAKNGQGKKGEDKSGSSSGNTTPTSGGDQTPWLQELAQRRRSRQSESPVKVDAGKESSPSVPEWKREVSLKKRPAVEPKDMKNKFSTEPEWKKEAEEKRKRLMNSGILQQK